MYGHQGGFGRDGVDWEIGTNIYTLLYIKWASPVAQLVKNLPANAGDVRDMGSIPGLGRSL